MPTNERYANKRRVVRRQGKFAKPPTMQERGIVLADGDTISCSKCGYVWTPIIKDCVCPSCLTAVLPEDD